MFSRSLRRASRSSYSIPGRACLSSRSPLATSAPTPCRSQQRRRSSSKTASPPGGPRGAEATAGNASRSPGDGERRQTGRIGRRKSKDAAAELAIKAKDEAFANLPFVQPTHHLHPADVAISSFFSLHRPISVTHAFPTTSTPSNFSTIFDAPKSLITTKPADVIYTLSSAVSALENGTPNPHAAGNNSGNVNKEEKDLRWEILQQSSSNSDQHSRNFGNAGQSPSDWKASVERLLKQFRPFNTPPVPQPIDEISPSQGVTSQLEGSQEGSIEPSTRQIEQQQRKSTRTYTTTLTITETTLPSGRKTYTGLAGDVVELSPRSRRVVKSRHPIVVSHRTVRRRQDQQRAAAEHTAEPDAEADRASSMPVVSEPQSRVQLMQLISVKRQRKLKMKKHKYKKLMRRTRNLRRREGRI